MDKLREYAESFGIPLTDVMLSQFAIYERILLDWNDKINLTAITEHQDVIIKHFLDSIIPLTLDIIPTEAAVIDVGTGAGFPGIPIRIVSPEIRLTLLDSLKKRVSFLETVSAALGQTDNVCVHARAEELARDKKYRETYDVALARAVASLPALLEYCLPYVRVGGFFIAMKGGNPEQEIADSEEAARLLGGKIEDVRRFSLPNENQRSLIVVRKISQTPTEYPRKGQKIAKNPLL